MTEHTPQHDDLQKKQELEAHEVSEVLDFLKRYGKLIGAGVLAAVVTVLLSKGIMQWQAARLTKAEHQLALAQTPEQLEAVVTQYGSTPVGPVALLDLAKLYFNGGDYAQARAQYDRFMKKYGRSALRPAAEIGLAYCTEAEGDLNGALAQFETFAKEHPGHFLRPAAILSAARCLEQAGRTDEARIALEDLLTESAGSVWAGAAEDALKALGAKAAAK